MSGSGGLAPVEPAAELPVADGRNALTALASRIGCKLGATHETTMSPESESATQDGSPFVLAAAAAQNGTVISQRAPLQAVGPDQPWSYAVVITKDPSRSGDRGGAIVTVDLGVRSGRVGVGLVTGDFSTFLCEVEVGAGDPDQVVRLPVEDLAEASALIIRAAGSGGAPAFEVRSLAVEKIDAATLAEHDLRQRGFRFKDALRDQVRLLKGEAHTILDVGANVGDAAAQYRAALPGAVVHAFEPHPATLEVLRKRFLHDRGVVVHGTALGSAVAGGTLQSFSNSAINSLLPLSVSGQCFVEGEVEARNAVAVPITTLDVFVGAERIERIDVLKIDTQGYEMEVLAGGRQTLTDRKVKLIFCEVNFVDIYEGQASYHSLARTLDEFGFSLFDYYDFRYSADGQLKWGDALFRLRP